MLHAILFGVILPIIWAYTVLDTADGGVQLHESYETNHLIVVGLMSVGQYIYYLFFIDYPFLGALCYAGIALYSDWNHDKCLPRVTRALILEYYLMTRTSASYATLGVVIWIYTNIAAASVLKLL